MTFCFRLIGAVAVTVPAAWYLWPSPSHADHGDHGSHEKHDDSHAEKEDAAQEEEKEDDQSQPEEKNEESDGSDEKSSDDDKDSDDDKSKDEDEPKEQSESKGDSDDVNFKGKTKQGKDDNRKVEDDSKGAQKKRIDSGLGRDLGDESEAKGVSVCLFLIQFLLFTNQSQAATAKSSQKGKDGDIGGKQHGLSNTPTRHSASDDKMKELSSKGEGTPDTAKSMGTVDPQRPQK